MKMKIAYDMTFLGRKFLQPENVTGIYRVAEEVMNELARRSDIEVKGVGLCGEDPVFSSLLALRYTEARANRIAISHCETFGSRLGMENCYRQLYSKTFMRIVDRIPEGSLCSTAFGVSMALLSIILRGDIYQGLDQSKCDIFHSSFLGLPPLRVTGTIPRVLTVYDLIPVKAPQYTNWRFKSFFERILNSVIKDHDWVICISEYTKQEFCEYTNTSPDRVFVTHLAAADRFCPVKDAERVAGVRSRYGIPPGNYFLTLAAPQPRKNLAHLIRSFCKFLAETKKTDINLVLVGSGGWKNTEIFDEIDRNSEFKSRILFTGYIQDSDLSAIYSGARAFVYPSLYEGFGLPLLEAMKCGVPVISSNATSLPEVVGDAGIIVHPQDGDALCQAMSTITENNAVWNNLKQKGLERAALFTWGKCAEDTVKAYKVAVNAQ